MTNEDKIRIIGYWGYSFLTRENSDGSVSAIWGRDANYPLDLDTAPRYSDIDMALRTAYGWAYWDAVESMRRLGELDDS